MQYLGSTSPFENELLQASANQQELSKHTALEKL